MTRSLLVVLLTHLLTAPLVNAYHREVTPTSLPAPMHDGHSNFRHLPRGAILRPAEHPSPRLFSQAGRTSGQPGLSANVQDRFQNSRRDRIVSAGRPSNEPLVARQIVWGGNLSRENSDQNKLRLSSRTDRTSSPQLTENVPTHLEHMAQKRQFAVSPKHPGPSAKDDLRARVKDRLPKDIVVKTSCQLLPLERKTRAAQGVLRTARAVRAPQARESDENGEWAHNVTIFPSRGPQQSEGRQDQSPSASSAPHLANIHSSSHPHTSAEPPPSKTSTSQRLAAQIVPPGLRADVGFDQDSRRNGSNQSRSTDFTGMSLAAAIFSNLTQRGEGIQTLLRGKPDPMTAFFRHAGRNPDLERAFPARTDNPDLRGDVRLLDDNYNVTGASGPRVARLIRGDKHEAHDFKGDNCSVAELPLGVEGWPLSEAELGLGSFGQDVGLIDCSRDTGATTRGQYQSAVTVFYGVAIPALCLLGLAGNALVTWLSVRAKLLPLCPRHCLVAMVVANSGLLLCELLHSTNVLVNQRYPLAGNHMAAHLYLPVYEYLRRAFANASPLLLLLLALERLFAVSRPLTRAHTLTTRHAMQLAIFVYITSFALYLPRMFQLQFVRVEQDNQTWYRESRTSWASGSYFRQMYPILQHVFRVWIPGLPLLLMAVVGSVLLVRTRQRQVALKRLALHAGKASRRMRRLLSSLTAIVMLSVLYVGAVLPEVTAELLSMTDSEFRLLGCRHYQKMLLVSVATLLMAVYAASPCPVFLAACPRLRRALAHRLRPKAGPKSQVWSAPPLQLHS